MGIVGIGQGYSCTPKAGYEICFCIFCAPVQWTHNEGIHWNPRRNSGIRPQALNFYKAINHFYELVRKVFCPYTVEQENFMIGKFLEFAAS